ncbi:unnamed protein product [Bemisia tabaci]|uniref:Sorting nexin-29 n=1 Tax=Bemisia tabaci TaxID=7038 RepID=A0A9P0C5F9_BEMTA|nr:unnamed protein product [Bemisia tabaci]
MKLMAAIVGTATSNASVQCDGKKLQENLQNAVKQCQSRYASRTELATELDHNVIVLCHCLEAILSHGLRPRLNSNKNGSVFQHVTNLVKELSNKDDNVVFWHFVSSLLTKHEYERYTALKHIWTDIGRGRAWLRSSLNEHSLERYLSSFIANTDRLQEFYQNDAFIRDSQLSAALLTTVSDLLPILFAINIDNAELNSSVPKNICANKTVDSEPVIISYPENINKLKERKRKTRNPIISFDDDNDLDHISSVTSHSSGTSCDGNTPINEVIPAVHVTKVESVEPESPTTLESEPEAAEEAALSEDCCKTSPPEKSLESSDVSLRTVNDVGLDLLIPIPSSSLMLSTLSTVTEETKSIELQDDDDFSEEERLKEENKDLSAQLESLKALKVDNQRLKTENEMLKHQLCNYVNAVRLLEKEEHNSTDEARLYEQKLVQVAEMHGELMELNSRLQRTLAIKDEIVKRLSDELTSLRGPLPSPDDVLAPSSLVNLWIPSAFLTGNVTDQHHVYQIHVRAGDDEWNVYRRYAQFFALCLDLKKKYPAISKFIFPPKKTLRKKRASLVNQRRGQLETWLRQVITHLLSTDPLLSSKHNLIITVPFLGENFCPSSDDRGSGSQSRNSDAANMSTTPQYMGL